MASAARDNPQTCRTCGSSLSQAADGGTPVCRNCVMVNIMGNSASAPGSTDADDYEIIKDLGRGGSGTVYLARDRDIGRQVAIKLLNNLRGCDKESVRRFRIEAELIASLDHPNIIPIYANGEMDGRPFFTMKYIEGGSLSTRSDEFREARPATELMVKLGLAVHHAHERGILHRDLKPSNILLDSQGDPFVTDFGIAKRQDDELDLTVTGAVMGTPAYMSPEQARGDRPAITMASDVFSMGAILFELLSGRRPFDGATSHAILRNVIEEDVTFTYADSSRLDRDLKTVCLKCIEKDPERRYPTALAFVEDLKRWQRGDPVEARHISKIERAWRWAKRYPWRVAAIVSLMVSLLGGTIVSLLFWHKAEGEREIANHHAEVARENAYYATIANAMGARERFDFGEARRLLANAPPDRRELAWRFVAGLSQSDDEWSTTLDHGRASKIVIHPVSGEIIALTSLRQLFEIDAETGKETLIGKLPDVPEDQNADISMQEVREFCYAPDGTHCAFIEGGQWFIANFKTSKIIHQGTASSYASLVWLDENRLLILRSSRYGNRKLQSATYKDTAWIFDLTTEETETLPPRGLAGAVAVSADRSRVAMVNARKQVVVFKIADGFDTEPEFVFSCKSEGTTWGQNDVRSIAFSPDGDYLAATWKFGLSIIKVFQLSDGAEVFHQVKSTPVELAFAPKGHHLLTMAGREVWFTSWRFNQESDGKNAFDDGQERSTAHQPDGPFVPPSRLLTRFTSSFRAMFHFGHLAPATSLVYKNIGDQAVLISAGDDGTVRRWRTNDQTIRKLRMPHAASSHKWDHPTASHDGKNVLYVHQGLERHVWHREAGTTTLLPPKETGLCLLNDGRMITRRYDGNVVCYQTDPKKPLVELWRAEAGPVHRKQEGPIHRAVTPDERRAVLLPPGCINHDRH